MVTPSTGNGKSAKLGVGGLELSAVKFSGRRTAGATGVFCARTAEKRLADR